jgi:ribosomal protein S18 acetylase RimI-like enzyme
MEIVKVESEDLIEIVAAIAHEVWHEHYSKIMNVEQINYMLEKFQSFHAIKKQIDDQKYQYYLLEDNDKSYFGFFAILQEDVDTLFLSKFYIKRSYRSKGYGSQAIAFIKTIAKKLDLPTIALIVNRNNLDSIKRYRKMGFEIVAQMDLTIGGGFEVNDYKMELEVK